MNVPWDAVVASLAVVVVATGPVRRLAKLVQRAVVRWRVERRARTEAKQFLNGCDLDLALRQLVDEHRRGVGPADDLMLLADEVFRDGEP